MKSLTCNCFKISSNCKLLASKFINNKDFNWFFALVNSSSGTGIVTKLNNSAERTYLFIYLLRRKEEKEKKKKELE